MVGRNLVDYFAAHKVEVIPTDLTGWPVSGNILDSEFVFTRLASLDFDAVVHLAAITEIKETIENPKLCFEVNCIGTLNMLELGSRKKVSRFVLASSANVFGAPKKNPVKEDSPFDPRVPYDYSKVICENLALSFFRTKGLPVSITRSWLLFGDYDKPIRATVRFIRSCIEGEVLTLFGAGKDKTSPSHAANYAKLVMAILAEKKAVGEAFNFGGEKAITVRQLAETIRRLTGSRSDLKIAPPRSDLEKEPQVSYPSIAKAKRLLGYQYELTLEEGLKLTIAWERKRVRQSE